MGGDGSGIDAGLSGLFVLIALFVAAGFLGASMLRHVRRVPPAFDPPAPRRRRGEAPPATDETPER